MTQGNWAREANLKGGEGDRVTQRRGKAGKENPEERPSERRKKKTETEKARGGICLKPWGKAKTPAPRCAVSPKRGNAKKNDNRERRIRIWKRRKGGVSIGEGDKDKKKIIKESSPIARAGRKVEIHLD